MSRPDDPSRTSPRGRRRLVAILVLVAVLLVAAVATVWAFVAVNGSAGPAPTAPPSAPGSASAPAPATSAPAETRITVSAMGDMLPHDAVNLNARTPDGGYDFARFFDGIRPLYADSDLVFCNQEVPSAGEALGISGYPTFNAPSQLPSGLVEGAGCNAINLANNHLADKGQAGIDATRALWDGLSPLLLSGANRSPAEQQAITYADVRGVRFALVSFAEYSNAPTEAFQVNLLGDEALLTGLMSTARANADVVLVSAHWGTEDSNEVNDLQRGYAARLAELGADVVIGTGPHVLQPVQWIDRPQGGRTLVWYSIGNMLNTQLSITQLVSVIAQFDVVRAPDGAISIEAPRAIPTYVHYDWTAEQEAAGDLLARTNLAIYPLRDAAEPLARTRFGTTVDEQLAYVASVLGPDVAIE